MAFRQSNSLPPNRDTRYGDYRLVHDDPPKLQVKLSVSFQAQSNNKGRVTITYTWFDSKGFSHPALPSAKIYRRSPSGSVLLLDATEQAGMIELAAQDAGSYRLGVVVPFRPEDISWQVWYARMTPEISFRIPDDSGTLYTAETSQLYDIVPNEPPANPELPEYLDSGEVSLDSLKKSDVSQGGFLVAAAIRNKTSRPDTELLLSMQVTDPDNITADIVQKEFALDANQSLTVMLSAGGLVPNTTYLAKCLITNRRMDILASRAVFVTTLKVNEEQPPLGPGPGPEPGQDQSNMKKVAVIGGILAGLAGLAGYAATR